MQTADGFADFRLTTPVTDADVGEALMRLGNWQTRGTELSFVYSRSKGGLIHVGRGRIVRCTEDVIHVDTTSGNMVVVLTSAKFSTEPQLFFTPGYLSSGHVEGVSVFLENFDWLFLSGDASPEMLAGAAGLPALR
jgi:hypothetical protein